jgi:hypothetical protein
VPSCGATRQARRKRANCGSTDQFLVSKRPVERRLVDFLAALDECIVVVRQFLAQHDIAQRRCSVSEKISDAINAEVTE